MARQLLCYSGINPNNDNCTHYFFSTISRYISELSNNLEATINLNNYRINANIAKISVGNILTEELASKITYIIDTDNEDYFRAYHVKSYVMQDFFVYQLEVDLWATYIYRVLFSKIHVTRCNRALNPQGEYDDVIVTYQRQEQNAHFIYDTGEGEGFIRDDRVWIVYLLEYNVEQSAIWGDQHVSATSLFASRLSDIRNGAIVNSVEQAVDAVGGIYKIQNGMDARTIQAWVLPQWLVDCGTITGGVQTPYYGVMQSKGHNGNYSFRGYYVYPNTKIMDFIGNTFELNNATFIGTRNNCFKPKRFVNKYMNDIGLYCFMGTNSLKVVMIQGDNQKDLTNDFEVMLTTNNGEVTGLRAVASVIGKTAVNTAGFMANYFKGDALGMAKTITGTIGKAVEQQPTISSAVGNGDASNLYWLPLFSDATEADARKLRFPIIKEVFRSTRDEEMHARMQGANFDEYISGFDYPLTKVLLGTGNHLTLNDTYIVATCCIEGAPIDAKNAIANKLSNGIYYKYLN